MTTVRAYLSTQQGDLLKSINLSERALEEMSMASPEQLTLVFQGAAVTWLGVNHRLLGNLDKAGGLFVEAAEINQKAGNYYAALASYEQLADLAVIRGRLHHAVDLYRSGLKLAQNRNETGSKTQGTLLATIGLHLGLGTVLYQLSDLAGAAAHLQRSAELFELGEFWGRMHAYTMLAYLKQAQGEFEPRATSSSSKAIRDVLEGRLVKRSVPIKALTYGKIDQALGGTVRQKVSLQKGIPRTRPGRS